MLNTCQMRKDILKMAHAAGSSGAHIGGSLSLVEIMAALYGGCMKFKANDADYNDKLILSKGHTVLAQYAALKQHGLLTDEDLLTYKQPKSPLTVHPQVNQNLGFECATGSLGMGLSFGAGLAFGIKLKGKNKRIFVVLGDGECNEGAIWETAMFAAHHNLDNLTVIIDKNGLQMDDFTDQINSQKNMAEIWSAIGWEVKFVDGHNVNELSDAIASISTKPLVIIARTVKGKGISFMENQAKWHNGVVTQQLFDLAMQELEDKN